MTTFTQKASWVGLKDIKIHPLPRGGTLDLSRNEKILVDDIVDHYRDFIRLGEDSVAMKKTGHITLDGFNMFFADNLIRSTKRIPYALSNRRFGQALSASLLYWQWRGGLERSGRVKRKAR